MNNQAILFINQQNTGSVSTFDGAKPYGVPVFYLYVAEHNAFYFLTKTTSKKYANLQKYKVASFSVFANSPPVVYTADCSVELLDLMNKNHSDILKKLVSIHSTQDYYPSPISTLTEDSTSLVKLTITDYNFKSYSEDIKKLSGI